MTVGGKEVRTFGSEGDQSGYFYVRQDDVVYVIGGGEDRLARRGGARRPARAERERPTADLPQRGPAGPAHRSGRARRSSSRATRSTPTSTSPRLATPAELTEWLAGRSAATRPRSSSAATGRWASAYNVAAGPVGPPLGYIPAGFGNAARHLLRLPRDPEGQVEVLAPRRRAAGRLRRRRRPPGALRRRRLGCARRRPVRRGGREAPADGRWRSRARCRTCGAASRSRSAPTAGSSIAGRWSCSSSGRPRSTVEACA